MGNAQSTSMPPPRPAPSHTSLPASPSPGCPMHALSSASPPLNPLNNMPDLSQRPLPSQSSPLSLERTLSSIPRSSLFFSGGASACPVVHSSVTSSKAERESWVYPSPQQFYNALVRKGWETPEESVPMMVAIHNWMNEAAWGEVLRWEQSYFRPPASTSSPSDVVDVSLMRFTGRPQDLSPKARFHLLLGTLFPKTYSSEKPFDRHDWMVARDGWGGPEAGKVHRYVIDYYSAPDDENGNPVFHLDVRPAIDDFASLRARLAEWAKVKQERWFPTQSSEMKVGQGSAVTV